MLNINKIKKYVFAFVMVGFYQAAMSASDFITNGTGQFCTNLELLRAADEINGLGTEWIEGKDLSFCVKHIAEGVLDVRGLGLKCFNIRITIEGNPLEYSAAQIINIIAESFAAQEPFQDITPKGEHRHGNLTVGWHTNGEGRMIIRLYKGDTLILETGGLNSGDDQDTRKAIALFHKIAQKLPSQPALVQE